MGLCQRNLYNLRQVDPGFSARNLVGVQLYPGSQAGSETHIKQTYERLRTRVANLSGVESVSIAAELPLSLGFWQVPVELPDHTNKSNIYQNIVDAGYFTTFGISILQGRSFNSGDRAGSPEAVLVNRKMADLFWPGEDALGKRLLVGDAMGHSAKMATVVGVTANGKYSDFDEPDRPVIYNALTQRSQGGFCIVAKTTGDPRLWIEPLARVVQESGLSSAFHPLTYEGWSNFPLLVPRLEAGVMNGLSALAILLALIGVAGAISHSVSQRKKELGIRVALGAGQGHLMGVILRQTFNFAGAGIAIGLALGTTISSLLRSQFFGIGIVEWTVLLPVGTGMLVACLAVAYWSAKPWIAVNAMEAVRHV
jgi:hypothetical protein